MSTLLEIIYQGVLEGDQSEVGAGVQNALETNHSPSEILDNALVPAMSEVGSLFEEGEYFVPEMLISARAMQAGMAILKPLLVEGGVEMLGKVVIGTVQGDLHDIGKNLVTMMLEGAGFEVIDLGVDVAPEKFVEAIKDHNPDILCMSALLTTTMASIPVIIEAIEQAGLRTHVKILIGGAPVTQDYADQVGADGFAQDASRAARLATTTLDK
ncbi:MAG: cobalamin-binding protein [Chloroflexi bacterium]|nr:cobalamin-binding protein [Chloroflexota bacterium]